MTHCTNCKPKTQYFFKLLKINGLRIKNEGRRPADRSTYVRRNTLSR